MIKYEDLMSLDLKTYEVPMMLSEKLFQYAQQEEDHDDYWTNVLLECAQHAKILEDRIHWEETL